VGASLVITVPYPKKKKKNLFMTTEEAKLLWDHIKVKYDPMWQVILAIVMFRGCRIKEACAMNLHDFQNEHFHKVDMILCKSHIHDEFPIIKEVAQVIKAYVLKNRHRMVNGYLFPARRNNSKEPHISQNYATQMFIKFRQSIGKAHSQFLDRTVYYGQTYKILDAVRRGIVNRKQMGRALGYMYRTIKTEMYNLHKKGYLTAHKANEHPELTELGEEYLRNAKQKNRYRIGWHSCRRWFETQLYEQGMKIADIAFIMRYKDPKEVYTYLDGYKIWKSEAKILESKFGDIVGSFFHQQQGQMRLDYWNK